MKNTFSHQNKVFEHLTFHPSFLSDKDFQHPERDAQESLLLVGGERKGFDHPLSYLRHIPDLCTEARFSTAAFSLKEATTSPWLPCRGAPLQAAPRSGNLQGIFPFSPAAHRTGTLPAKACQLVIGTWTRQLSHNLSNLTDTEQNPHPLRPIPFSVNSSWGSYLAPGFRKRQFYLTKVSEKSENLTRIKGLHPQWLGCRRKGLQKPQGKCDPCILGTARCTLLSEAGLPLSLQEGSAVCIETSSFSSASGNTSVRFQVHAHLKEESETATDLGNQVPHTQHPGLDEATTLTLPQL